MKKAWVLNDPRFLFAAEKGNDAEAGFLVLSKKNRKLVEE